MASISDTYAKQLQLNHQGDRVKYLQSLLGIVADGAFGKKTKDAVIAFQKKHALNADGVVDAITADKMKSVLKADVSKLLYSGSSSPFTLPIKISGGKTGMCEKLGNPWTAGFRENHLVRITLPGEIFYSGKAVTTSVHAFMRDPLLACSADMVAAGLKFHTFDGCWNVRLIRGSSSKWSVHSWGAALDVDASRNPLGAKPTMDPKIVSIFEKNGFRWGGRWSRPDGMHFQIVSSY